MLHRTWIFCTGGATAATGTGCAAAAASADGFGAGGSGRKDLRLQVLLAVVEPESAVGWHAVRQLTRHGGLSRSVDARTHARTEGYAQAYEANCRVTSSSQSRAPTTQTAVRYLFAWIHAYSHA